MIWFLHFLQHLKYFLTTEDSFDGVNIIIWSQVYVFDNNFNTNIKGAFYIFQVNTHFVRGNIMY